VSGCCRSDPIDITEQSIDHYINLWEYERQQLAQGIELPGCRHCWKAENTGQQSYRQQMAGYNKNVVEIFSNNACNQMCSYCSPKFSSKWEDSIRNDGNFVNISKSSKDNLSITQTAHQDTDFWLTEIASLFKQGQISVSLLGGEPLMQKQNLKKLLELNTNNIESLHITTNLNPPSNKFLKWVLDTFPRDKLLFNISLDALPAQNAIPRAGFDQHKFNENLELLKQYNVSFMFLSVVSVLNIFNLNEYYQWITQNNYKATFFRINNPDCLDPCYLPDEFKQSIDRTLLPGSAIHALNHTTSTLDLKLFEQYNYLKQYFYRTGTILTDPKFAEYWAWLEGKFK
jgi:organic radical activating enzyme